MQRGFGNRRELRPTTKVLPEHARGHNRSLVMQTLYREGQLSRADIARETGLTRVTVSDLVSELLDNTLVLELGQREDIRPGKPATLLELNRNAFCILGVDLSDYTVFRGAVLDLHGTILERVELPLASSTGADAEDKVFAIVDELVAQATRPILGIGVGSPGVVDLAGVVLTAPNLGWNNLPLQARLAERSGLPVLVINDANAAALAEHSFGGARSDMMLIKVGHGVGSGLLMGGIPLYGNRFAAGEIGHVVVGTDGGARCVCGKDGCLETWLALPRLYTVLEAAKTPEDRDEILRVAGERLGIALAPVVGALDLAEIVLSGPTELLDGTLASATVETLRARTIPEFHGSLVLRMTELGEDIVLRGAAVVVLAERLGVS